MKKLKKLTAVLLAAVMALAMLTACGGGGSSRSEKERYISKVNSYLGKGVTNFQELTDENLPEIGAEYEISDEKVEKIMKNPPTEYREMENKILWTISSREDGGVEVWPGSKGCIVLRSEADAEWFCERIIRSFRQNQSRL